MLVENWEYLSKLDSLNVKVSLQHSESGDHEGHIHAIMSRVMGSG